MGATHYLGTPLTVAGVTAHGADIATLHPNPQLLLDKWARARRDGGRFSFSTSKQSQDTTDPRRDTLREVSEAARRAATLPETISRRILAHLPAAAGWPEAQEDPGIAARLVVMETTSPLALHLSRSNPLENAAVCLHRLWGVPCLLGSGLKGAARTAALYRMAEDHPGLVESPGEKGAIHQVRWNVDGLPGAQREAARRRVLLYALAYGLSPEDGDLGRAARAQELEARARTLEVLAPLMAQTGIDPRSWPEQWAGGVVFWDALPAPARGEGVDARVEMDVLTAHQPGWYRGGTSPSETEAPIPIPFPVIRGAFTFALSKRRAGDGWGAPFDALLNAAGPGPDPLASAMADLVHALEDWGVGAKTAAGYGRFKIDAARTREVGQGTGPGPTEEEEYAALEFEEAHLTGLPSYQHLRGNALSDAQQSLAAALAHLKDERPRVWRLVLPLIEAAVDKKSRSLKNAMREG